MFHFEVNPSLLSGEAYAVLILAALLFIVLPLLLIFFQYRITRKNKTHGLYLLLGVFASAILLGIFSIFVGIILAVIYWAASHFPKEARAKATEPKEN